MSRYYNYSGKARYDCVYRHERILKHQTQGFRRTAKSLGVCMSACEIKDYYALLGVGKSSDMSEIHRAYWRQACRCHPDRGGNNEAMAQVAEAWATLSDPSKRARYDQSRPSQHDEWRTRKFRDDVRESQIKAYKRAYSWAEFEKIYLKAYDIFIKDLEQTDRDVKGTGQIKIHAAGESVIVCIFNYMTDELFVAAPPLTNAASLKPAGKVVFYTSIFLIAMFVGFGLGALVHNLFS